MSDQDAAPSPDATHFTAVPPLADADATRFSGGAPADADGTRFGSTGQPGTSPTPSAPPAARDRRLPRRFAGYELLEEVARGGMGVVYKAHQIGPDGKPLRLVALKMVLGGAEAAPEVIQRFWGEARAVAGLNHPGIVPIVEAGDHDGQPFYSMEFVEGGSLAARIKEGGPLPPREATRLVRQVAEAVQAAHEKGIIHRDIKPANVLLSVGQASCLPSDGRQDACPAARLTDFGLARTREGGGSMTGEKLGTPAYMAPEQASGSVRAVSAATDVYGLGAVLYCLLTGRPPFWSSSPLETMRLVLEEEPVPVRQLNPAVPRDLETVCHKCLQKEPGKRYASAAELAAELGRFLGGEPVQARPVGRLERGWRWCKRNPSVASLLAAVVLLLAAGTALVTWQWLKAEQALARAERAQQERALAQVHALTEAAPGAVPGLLAELADNRDTVLPRLRELWQQGGDRGRRLRVGLALLPVEPESVRDELARGMLEVEDPAEMLLYREQLAAHGPKLAAGLWRVVDDPATKAAVRFRALVALARFDPANPRWPSFGATVVEELLSANPLYLGAWVGALRPVRAALLGSLAEVFRGRRLAEFRQVAATVLADWAEDRPGLVADLLMDADPKQDALLFPVLKRHREQAVRRLHEELDRRATFDWKDALLDPAWKTPDAALVRRLEAAQGMVAERFALCQALPLKQFDEVAAALAKAGYRPVRLRPYAAAGGPRVAAVWARDGRAWRVVHGVSAADVRRKDAEQRKGGYQPADVAGYLAGEEERYAALWVRGEAEEEGRLYVGVPELRHKTDGWGPLRAAKLQPATLHSFTLADGSSLFSSVWRKPTPEGNSTWSSTEQQFAGHAEEADQIGLDVSLTFSRRALEQLAGEAAAWAAGPPWPALAWRSRQPALRYPTLRYAAAWQASGTLESVQVPALEAAAHLARCRALLAQGFRPAALSVLSPASRGRQPPDSSLLAASVWQRPVVAEAAREHLAKRQASAAAALLRLGRPERVWPLLRHRPDPRVRSYLIHRLSPLGADPHSLWRRFEVEPDVSARRALVLCLGEFTEKELPAAERAKLLPRLFALYRNDPDPGLHGAAAWLLGRWGQRDKLRELDRALASRDRALASRGRQPPDARRWYVNGQKQTMVLVPGPVVFRMGSPRTEAEREGGADGRLEQRHYRRIGRSFAIAAHEVTVEQFLKFRADFAYNKTYARSPDCPINNLTWFDAAAYCNWLSEQEGIPEEQWCYLPNADGKFAEGMKVRPNFLGLTGYRLPTEAEWEYACRAGAVTARYYGETDELLPHHAWYSKNSLDRWPLPVGTLEPNDLGLFDMLGNDFEWCQDPLLYYTSGRSIKPSDDKGYIGDLKGIQDRYGRLLRGGAFANRPRFVRSAFRSRNRPSVAVISCGLRPARTYR